MKKIVKLVNVRIFSEFNNNAEFNKVQVEPDIQFGFVNDLGGSWSRYHVSDLFKTVKPAVQDKSFYRYTPKNMPDI